MQYTPKTPKQTVDKYIAGRVVINGVDHFTGEASQAAKNLFFWKLYSLPLTEAEALAVKAPVFLAKGKAKSLNQAEMALVAAYETKVKPVMESIKLANMLDDFNEAGAYVKNTENSGNSPEM